MSKKDSLPVYSIDDFKPKIEDWEIYVNFLRPHVTAHDFTNYPHKHDFYLLVLITEGSGKHEIDFESYKVERGSLFILRPGQMHAWTLSDNVTGFVLFHSQFFFDSPYNENRLKQFSFYRTSQHSPLIKLEDKSLETVQKLMEESLMEYTGDLPRKWQKINSLINLIYIEAERNFQLIQGTGNGTYLLKLRQFEELIELNFQRKTLARDYASMLNMSEKHLNRIVQSTLSKTSSQLIMERIILEAKRLILQKKLNINQISDFLGFKETSYFIRVFKKLTGTTPIGFLKKYEERS